MSALRIGIPELTYIALHALEFMCRCRSVSAFRIGIGKLVSSIKRTAYNLIQVSVSVGVGSSYRHTLTLIANS